VRLVGYLKRKASQLMLYREIIAVSSEIYTKHINTLCGQDVELLNYQPGGTYSYHWALNGSLPIHYSRFDTIRY
jgi:hypothetical protein